MNVGFAITREEQSFVRSVGDHPAVWFLTNRMTFLAGSEETNNAYALVHTVTQDNGAPPPHIHAREDEAFYMIRGSGKYLVNDRAYLTGPGTLTYLPRGLAHSPILLSEDAELLILAAPGEFSNFFRQQSIPAATPGLPNLDQAHMPVMEEIFRTGSEFGLTFLPPGTAVSSWPVPDSHGEPNHLLAGEGERLNFFGSNVTIKLAGCDTQNLFSVFEIEDLPGAGFPAHISNLASEGYYVLEGDYEFQLDGEIRQAGPGSFVYVPAGIRSGYKNRGAANGRLLLVTAAAGHEDLFRSHPKATPSHQFSF